MNIPQPLIQAYNELSPFLEEVEKRALDSLRRFARSRLVPVVSRIKTVESAAEKIETGRYGSFADIDDLVAYTLVIPNLPQEEEAISYCRSVFRIIDIKKRASTRKSPELFRFDATRLYGFLSKPEGEETDARIFKIKFEIQIRTAFEHAWVVATHPLTYKSDSIDWKRVRLSAQIKAATEQLDLSIVQFEQLAAVVNESPWPELEERSEIVKFIRRLGGEGIIPSEANPKDMTRFADNLMSLLRASKKEVKPSDAISELDKGLRAFSADSFPMSASLLQVCMGILCEKGLLAGPLGKYSCHVTDELIQLFPEVRTLSPAFEYGIQTEQIPAS